jgi:tRNA-dihydrouridine synthase B
MLKIGNYTLKSRLILAPLSGCTDLPFRTICRAHGCKFAFYEMLDAHGLTYGHKKTLQMLESDKKDSPIGVQILGSDPDRCLEAAHIIIDQCNKSVIATPMLSCESKNGGKQSKVHKSESNLKLIDLNFACPAKKVLKKGCGAALLKDPEKAAKVVKKLASSLSLPITIKVRAGYYTNDGKEGVLLSRMCEDNGVKAVFFHGRSMSQGYSGRVNYDAIKQAKKTLDIPVFGSGDVFSPELAKEMLDKTSCDGVLIARGAFGSPWIFDQTENYLKDPSSTIDSVSYEMIVDTAKEHLNIYKNWKKFIPEKYYIGHLRKIGIWYSKGLPYSKRAREAISGAKSFDEIIEILDKLKSNYDIKWLKR